MRILVLSDVHGRIDCIEQLADVFKTVEAVCLCGDITHFGDSDDAAQIIQKIQAACSSVVAVAGNCDSAAVERFLHQNKLSLHSNCIACGGYFFVGASGSLPCPGTTPNEFPESFFEAALTEAFEKALVLSANQPEKIILTTHQPAYGTRLDISCGRHTGSRSIRRAIELYRPAMALSGHIHEASGTDRIGNTTLVNPGPLRDGRYAIIDDSGGKPAVSLYNLCAK